MKYLFIGAHVDDVELCAGATIARLKDEGHFVTVMTLSHVYEGVDLLSEWKESMRILKPDLTIYRKHETRNFESQRQDILNMMFSYTNYDYIFTHSSEDIHLDHKVTGQSAERAFKTNNLISFIGTWNQKTITKNFFIKVNRRHLEIKMKALEMYESQRHRKYMSEDYIMSEAIVNGIMCNSKYAESFKVFNVAW